MNRKQKYEKVLFYTYFTLFETLPWFILRKLHQKQRKGLLDKALL
jgi:hypothetical protein